MNTKVKWLTLIPAILGAIKLIAQPYGIDIPDEDVNAAVNGAAAIANIIGIFVNQWIATHPPAVQKKAEVIDYH